MILTGNGDMKSISAAKCTTEIATTPPSGSTLNSYGGVSLCGGFRTVVLLG